MRDICVDLIMVVVFVRVLAAREPEWLVLLSLVRSRLDWSALRTGCY